MDERKEKNPVRFLEKRSRGGGGGYKKIESSIRMLHSISLRAATDRSESLTVFQARWQKTYSQAKASVYIL